MFRICIHPSSYTIHSFQKDNNPFIAEVEINKKKALNQHANMVKKLKNTATYLIKERKTEHLSDIVFAASAGVCLPRFPNRTVILPSMKYPHREDELKYIKEIFRQLDIQTVDFPKVRNAPFEGQAEVKWFHDGKKAVFGYGHRSTRKSFDVFQKLVCDLYKSHNLASPEFIALPLQSNDYYHLDLAMLEFDKTDCIVHRAAFSKKSIDQLQQFLGKDHVHIIDTNDAFCLNSVVDGPNLITHKFTDPAMKEMLSAITRKNIIQTDVSEFELSGGSVRCMIMDIYNN